MVYELTVSAERAWQPGLDCDDVLIIWLRELFAADLVVKHASIRKEPNRWRLSADVTAAAGTMIGAIEKLPGRTNVASIEPVTL